MRPMRLATTTASAAFLLLTTSSIAAQARGSTGTNTGPFETIVDLERLPVLSQDRAGTCWAFATTSFLESELHRMHGRAIDLSELHTVYYAYLEKARRFVQLHGNGTFGQGGLSHDVFALVGEHGVVPAASYTGLLDDAERHDHTEMESVLRGMLEPLAKSKRLGPHWESAVRSVLSSYLGEPPTSISVDGEQTTPEAYAHETLKIPVDDYRQLMSLPSRSYWRQHQLMVPDNWMHHDDYWNVPVDVMLENLDHALEQGFTAAIDIDVSERGARSRDGIWRLPSELEADGAVTDEVRQQMFDSRETTDDHLVHIVGAARDKSGKTFYLTKNSHGKAGPFGGNVYISRNYLAAKLLSFMVHKDALLEDTLTRTSGD